VDTFGEVQRHFKIPLSLLMFLTRIISLFVSLSAVSSFAQQVVISEFMPDNSTTGANLIVDEDGDREDWLEIWNVSSAPISLNGWYLTDEGPADPSVVGYAPDLRKWQFPVSSPSISIPADGRIVVWCSAKNRKANSANLHTNFKLDAGGERLALVRPDGVTVEHAFGPQFGSFGFKYPPVPPNRTYGTVISLVPTVVLPDGSSGRFKIPATSSDIPANWKDVSFDDSLWATGFAPFGYGVYSANPPIATNLSNVPASAFFRFTFNMSSITGASAVRLRVRYDDGVVSYVNGVQMSALNAPNPPSWNSTTGQKPDSSVATQAASVNSSIQNQLVVGTNVLAIQLVNFNDGAADAGSNAYLRPSLEVDFPSGFSTGYFSTATKGAVNTSVTTSIPPDIAQVTEDAEQPVGGVGSAPILVTAKVTKTLSNLNATNPVQLKWRRMYDAENTINMVDNGLNGDVTAGDGVFSALVPTTTLNPGDMLRWRIEARDTSNLYSFSPPYPTFANNAPQTNPSPDATTEAELYYGTVAQVGTGNSTLPLLHWFFTGTDNTVNNTGTRCSFYFKPFPKDNPGPGYVAPKGRFYDNVLVNIHGQSTQGMPKKSHDLSFSKDKKFRWKDGEPDSSGTNILSNYADKSKVRNTVAWEAFEKSGHLASHYSHIVRVHQNGTFKGLYDLVENANEAWLERTKLDKTTGALYKVYNRLDSATLTTANNSVEKKNPDDGNNADLAAFVAGIASTNAMTDRLRFLYDNGDIASAINWLATHSILLGRDFGHKNYYIYRDTAGTREWSVLPWDQDLSLGHTWTGTGGGYFNDDIHSQGPLQIGVADNRLIQIVYGTPELNAMFVRRLRTLADGFFGSATETNSHITQRVNSLLDQIDPNPNNPQTGVDDADIEARAWGFWVDGSGTQITYTDGRMNDHTVRAQGARITHSNPNPPYPSTGPVYGDWGDGSTSVHPFVLGRRDFFFSPTPPTSGTLAFPASQSPSPTLVIEQFSVNPTSGIPSVIPAEANPQSFEYFVIRNTSAEAIDVSNWKITGDIDLTFRGGTVIPAQGASTSQGANAAYINQLVVANKPFYFRQRTASPKGNEYRLVTGPYNRQLSARGGSITLSKPTNPMNLAAGYTPVVTQSYIGTATSHQNFLRVSELNFRPAPATAAELLVLPGLVASDFEFIELVNSGPTTLDLGGARFDDGVTFVFPAGFTLASGARCLVVASQTAFEIRYGSGHPIAGEFEGNLDNGGEVLRIEDPAGEEVLDFTYDDDWFPVPSGQYRSFVTRATAPDYTSYNAPTTWALSSQQNGTPNGGDTQNSRVFEGWRWDHFTLAEVPTALNPNTAGALLADPDGDGMNNFTEFAFGRQPRNADQPGSLAVGGRTNVSGSDHLCVTFRRAKSALDVTYFVEVTSDLSNPASWTNTGVLVSATDLGNGTEEVCFRDPNPIGSTPRYMRVRASKP
jgi:hypothetical protein